MADTVLDLSGNTIKAKALDVENLVVESTEVDVAAYVAGGITAGNLQAVLEALADRIDTLENA